MSVRDGALAALAARQSQERSKLREMARQFDAAESSAAAARAALADAEAARGKVLAEWAAIPGWTAALVAETTGVELTIVRTAVRAAGGKRRRRTPGTLAAPRGDEL